VQVCCAGGGRGDMFLPQPPLRLPAQGAEHPTLRFWPPGTPRHHHPMYLQKCGSIPWHRGAASCRGDAADASQPLIQHTAAIPPRSTSLGCADSTRASQPREKIPAASARVRHGSVRWHRGLCHAVPRLPGDRHGEAGSGAGSEGPYPPALPPRTPRVSGRVISYACSVEIKHVLQNK